jgi:hypothetical protein
MMARETGDKGISILNSGKMLMLINRSGPNDLIL